MNLLPINQEYKRRQRWADKRRRKKNGAMVDANNCGVDRCGNRSYVGANMQDAK